MEKNVKIEVEIGGLENLDEALLVSKIVFEPTPVEEEKFHNKEDWKKKIENDGVLVVGKVDGKVVGFIVAYKTTDEVMHVWNAGVILEYRKMGIFSNMFEELSVRCKQNGIKKITLHAIEQRHPEMYKYVINKGFVEYEKEWVEDDKIGQTEKTKFELSL